MTVDNAFLQYLREHALEMTINCYYYFMKTINSMDNSLHAHMQLLQFDCQLLNNYISSWKAEQD